MAARDDNLRTIAAAVLFIAVVVGVIYAAGDWGEESVTPAGSVRAPAPLPRSRDRAALPSEITRLEHAMALALREALAWKDDARTVRLYATEVARDGTFDRSASVIQIVFVSLSASQSPDVKNGWRWSVARGAYGSEEIWQHPAPRMDGPVARVCDLTAAVGEDGPARFTVDARFAESEGQTPAFTLFTSAPRKWLVRLNPATCEVVGKSTPMTDEEARERDAAPDDGGVWFAAREATKALSAVIDAAGDCRRDGGAAGPGTVSVTFDPTGRATKVQFLAGDYTGTDTGTCLERRLLSVRVAPWTRGDGRAAARFRW